MSKKLWGGRFSKETDSLAHQLNASLPFDVRLYDEDITASIAWARGLVRAGVLTMEEAETIIAGLEEVRLEFQAMKITFAPADEDIHTAVERRLTEIVGAGGGQITYRPVAQRPGGNRLSRCGLCEPWTSFWKKWLSCNWHCWRVPGATPTCPCPATPICNTPSR